MKYFFAAFASIMAILMVDASALTFSEVDTSALQTHINNRQCPRPPAKYNLLKYDLCGPIAACNSNFQCSSDWGRCSRAIDQHNVVISRYNTFIDQVCSNPGNQADLPTSIGLNETLPPSLRRELTMVEQQENDRKANACLASIVGTGNQTPCERTLKNYASAPNYQDLRDACHRLGQAQYFYCYRKAEERRIDEALAGLKSREDAYRAAISVATGTQTPKVDTSAGDAPLTPGQQKVLEVKRLLEQQVLEAAAREKSERERKERESKTPSYTISRDLRTNCGGSGLYLVRGRTAYNVVCSGSNSRNYCESRPGQRYAEIDGDKLCIEQ